MDEDEKRMLFNEINILREIVSALSKPASSRGFREVAFLSWTSNALKITKNYKSVG